MKLLYYLLTDEFHGIFVKFTENSKKHSQCRNSGNFRNKQINLARKIFILPIMLCRFCQFSRVFPEHCDFGEITFSVNLFWCAVQISNDWRYWLVFHGLEAVRRNFNFLEYLKFFPWVFLVFQQYFMIFLYF